MEGVINVTAPNPLSNMDFMTLIRKKVKFPFAIPSPVWLLEIAAIFIKTETELMLKSRNVFPKRLLDNGFKFQNPDFSKALKSLISWWEFFISKAKSTILNFLDRKILN